MAEPTSTRAAFCHDRCLKCEAPVVVDTDRHGKLVELDPETWRMHRCEGQGTGGVRHGD